MTANTAPLERAFAISCAVVASVKYKVMSGVKLAFAGNAPKMRSR